MSNIKLSDSMLESLRNDCVSDSTKVIRYLELQNAEQSKINKRNLKISLITLFFSAIATIGTIIGLFL